MLLYVLWTTNRCAGDTPKASPRTRIEQRRVRYKTQINMESENLLRVAARCLMHDTNLQNEIVFRLSGHAPTPLRVMMYKQGLPTLDIAIIHISRCGTLFSDDGTYIHMYLILVCAVKVSAKGTRARKC